jgi:hypothetical protein
LGSIDKKSGKSFTQLEYERAYRQDKHILIYIIDEQNSSIPPKYVDRGEENQKLVSFKKLLRKRHTVASFISEDNLVQQLRNDFHRLLQSKTIMILESKDEFETSATQIKDFLLTPKIYSGNEVRLEIQIDSAPFPASRSICQALNLEFGSTIGMDIKILKPEGYAESGIDNLFLPAKLAEEFLPAKPGASRGIYAKLQFADAKIDRARARFRSETNNMMGIFFENLEIKDHPADGTICLLLTRSVDG